MSPRVDAELEPDPAFASARVAQRISADLAEVLRGHPVELFGDPGTLDGIVLGDLSGHRRLDADPVVRIPGIHQQEGRLRILSEPVHLLAVRRQVEQHPIAFVVEPDRGEVRSPGAARY